MVENATAPNLWPPPPVFIWHVRLKVFSTDSNLDHLSGVWQELAAAAVGRSYIHLWPWHRAYLNALAPEDENLVYAAIYDGETCVALLPLVQHPIRVAGLELAALSLPTHDHVPHADILIRPDYVPRLSWPWLQRALVEQVAPFDVLQLEPVLSDSGATAVLLANRPRLAMSEVIGASDALPTGSYEALLAKLSRNFRGNLRKARNKLEQYGSAARVTHAPSDTVLTDAFSAFLALEASGWKGRAGSSTAISLAPRLRDFYRQIVESLGSSGVCAIHLLWLKDKPIAAQLSLTVAERCYLLKIGYDETHAHLAPGNLLLERLLTAYDKHPVVKYVDLVSDADWHTSWKPEVRAVFRHLLFCPTPRGIFAWAALQGKAPLRRLRDNLKVRLKQAVMAFRISPL